MARATRVGSRADLERGAPAAGVSGLARAPDVPARGGDRRRRRTQPTRRRPDRASVSQRRGCLTLQRNRRLCGQRQRRAARRARRDPAVAEQRRRGRAATGWRCASTTLMQHPELGSVASKVLFTDAADDQQRRRRCSAATWRATPARRRPGRRPAVESAGPVFGAMGGAAAFRRAMLADVGCWTRSFFMYLEDVDLAFRAQLRGLELPVPAAGARATTRAARPAVDRWLPSTTGATCFDCSPRTCRRGCCRALLPGMLRVPGAAGGRGRSAAWRGAAARATLRGQLVGLAELPRHLADRRAIQSRRRVSDATIYGLLRRASPALSLITPGVQRAGATAVHAGRDRAPTCAPSDSTARSSSSTTARTTPRRPWFSRRCSDFRPCGCCGPIAAAKGAGGAGRDARRAR